MTITFGSSLLPVMSVAPRASTPSPFALRLAAAWADRDGECLESERRGCATWGRWMIPAAGCASLGWTAAGRLGTVWLMAGWLAAWPGGVWLAAVCARAQGTTAHAVIMSSDSDKRMSVPRLRRRRRRRSRSRARWSLACRRRARRRGRLHGRAGRRRWSLAARLLLDTRPVLQLRDPHHDWLVLASQPAVLLEITERGRWLIEIEIAQHATITVCGRVSGICRDRSRVRLLRV